MNIFKHLYPVVKKELFKFRKKFKEIQYTDSYWKTVYAQCLNETHGWNKIISEYLCEYCNEERRRIIDFCLFQKKSKIEVSCKLPISERSVYAQCKEYLLGIIAFALDSGLLHIDRTKLKK